MGVSSASIAEPSRIVLWDLAPASTGVQGSVEVCPAIATGVRALDFSPSGKLFLALLADHDSTLCVYRTATQQLLFTAPLSGALVAPTMEGASGRVRVTDVRFGGNDSVLVVTGSHGVHFYVDEGNISIHSSYSPPTPSYLSTHMLLKYYLIHIRYLMHIR